MNMKKLKKVIRTNNKTNKKIHNHINNKHKKIKKVKKVIYDYKNFCIRKAVQTRDFHSICVNLPKSYCKTLNWVGGQSIKIRIVGEKIVITKIG